MVDLFFWVDAKVFPIPVSLYVGGTLEKDPAPHLTDRQEQTVKLLENNKAHFRRYLECFLCLVGLSPYYPFNENTYPAFERPDGTGGSSSAAAPEVSAPEVSAPEVSALAEQSDTLPAKQLRKDHPSLATGTGGKTLAGLRQLMPTSPLVSRPSSQADIQAHVVQSARIADVPVYTAAATVTSARENVGVTPTSDVAGSSQLETSEGSDDSFYELPVLNSAEAKRWLLEEKDLEILRLKSLLVEEAEKAERAEKAEATEVVRVRGQVSALTGESALDDSKAPCAEAGSLITSLTSERDRLTSEVSYLHTAFHDLYREGAEAHRKSGPGANKRVAELEAHVMDVFGRLEREFYPAYLTTLAGGRWFLTNGIQLAVLKCFKSLEYPCIPGHGLGRAMDFGMHVWLERWVCAWVAGTPLCCQAFNPEAVGQAILDAVRALGGVGLPMALSLVGALADLDEATTANRVCGSFPSPSFILMIRSCGEDLSSISLSVVFALLNVHSRAEGAKKHAAALRQLMMEIVSNPLSSQTWVGETSTSAAPLSVEDFDEVDTDEALGSVVAIPKFICKASSFFVGSTSIVRSVGMPISAGMTASVSYVSENDVSLLLDLIIVRWDHRTCESSPIQSLLLSSNLAFIPSPKLMFALSTKLFVCGCFTEAKH
ncbi:hypothetical protein Tco_0111098 [Tanacetum coccineum]